MYPHPNFDKRDYVPTANLGPVLKSLEHSAQTPARAQSRNVYQPPVQSPAQHQPTYHKRGNFAGTATLMAKGILQETEVSRKEDPHGLGVTVNDHLRKNGLCFYPVPGDGNCMFHCIARALNFTGGFAQARSMAAGWLKKNKAMIEHRTSVAVTDEVINFITTSGEWDHEVIDVIAGFLSEIFGRNFDIHQCPRATDRWMVISSRNKAAKNQAVIHVLRRGAHYDLLVPAPVPARPIQPSPAPLPVQPSFQDWQRMEYEQQLRILREQYDRERAAVIAALDEKYRVEIERLRQSLGQ